MNQESREKSLNSYILTLNSKKQKLENILFYLLVLFISTQFGKHFWPDFSSVLGIRIDYLSPTVYLTDILVILLFSLWLHKVVKNFLKESRIKNQESRRTKTLIHNSYLLIFALLFLLGNILFSGRFLGGAYSALKIIEMAFLAYYTAKFITKKGAFQKVIMLFSIGAISQSFLAIVQYIRQGSVGGLFYFFGERFFTADTPGIANASLNGELVLRPYGTFPHPNVLAGYLVVVLALILFMLCFRKTEKELRVKKQEVSFARQIFSSLILNSYFLIQVIALFLGTSALILSMSRIAILLWIVVVAYFVSGLPARRIGGSRIQILESSPLPRNTKRIFLAFAILVLAAITLFTPLGVRFTGSSLTDESITQRSQLIESSAEMIKTNPLFGVGLGNFLPTLSKIHKPQPGGYFLQPVHNIFLLVAAETGLVGLSFFIYFLWKTFQRVKREALRGKEVYLIIFLSILVLGLFDHYWLTLQQGQLLFAFILGMCFMQEKLKP